MYVPVLTLGTLLAEGFEHFERVRHESRGLLREPFAVAILAREPELAEVSLGKHRPGIIPQSLDVPVLPRCSRLRVLVNKVPSASHLLAVQGRAESKVNISPPPGFFNIPSALFGPHVQVLQQGIGRARG